MALFHKLKKTLHRHPKVRNGVRWARWQLKKVPLVSRASIAFDRAYFRHAGVERPDDEHGEGPDEYFETYAAFIVPRTYGRVLDVGCGHGYLTERIAERPEVTAVMGIDKTADFKRRSPKIQYRTADLTEGAPFPGPFDAIVASEFVEHISEGDHEKLLKRIAEALSPDGVYLGSTPRNPTNFATFSGSRFHVREYNRRDLEAILELFFNDVRVVRISEYCLAWEARGPRPTGPVRLHLGCGEKYLEGYTNIDFPEDEHTVMKPKVDVYADVTKLSYPEGSVDEIRSHHLFEHFSRAEALKLLTRWRKWLRPGGLLIIETPDFATSAAFYVQSSSLKRRFELARHIVGSEEAGWAFHKDVWDKKKFAFVLGKLGFGDVRFELYHNGLARHAHKLPLVGKAFARMPYRAYAPFLNAAGTLLPSSFYEKYGSHKLPNILVAARKDADAVFDERAAVKGILSMYLVGREGKPMLDVWLREYERF